MSAGSDISLTKNQSLVLGVLSSANAPLSAYAILDSLKEEGFRAPLQVYRAIEKLQELSLVHRLESLNAFVACKDPGCSGHQITAFAICNDCTRVEEISDHKLTEMLEAISAEKNFSLESSVVELSGKCRDCTPSEN